MTCLNVSRSENVDDTGRVAYKTPTDRGTAFVSGYIMSAYSYHSLFIELALVQVCAKIVRPPSLVILYLARFGRANINASFSASRIVLEA